MLKINAVKLEVNTNSGLYGAFFEFGEGLNIIRGNNTSGKSSLYQSIIYCLGFEELLGGRNEKTMQSVLKETIEYPKKEFHAVLQSFAFLEIENAKGDAITIKRGVKSSGRKSQLIDVYTGKLLTANTEDNEPQPMYIHDKGGASDETYGFHSFLETFLEWELPEVLTKMGDSRRLYLQQVAPSFIIEQKSGWSGFLATMPHYGLANKEARVIEFLLGLNVTENKKKKQKSNLLKREVQDKWHNKFLQIQGFIDKGAGKLIGIDHLPRIINSESEIKILIEKDENSIPLSEYIGSLISDYETIEQKELSNVSDKIGHYEERLEALNDFINTGNLSYEMLASEIILDKNRLTKYQEQLALLKEDLRKNKGALKVKKLGADIKLDTAVNNCPTCHQNIPDSLLPIEVLQSPMGIEDNVKFVESQVKMVEVYIDGQNKKIAEKDSHIALHKEKLSEYRSEIRQIKIELVADGRLPSEYEIEQKINLKRKIDFYIKYQDRFDEWIEEFMSLSSEWKEFLESESKLPTDYFSHLDMEKLDYLKNTFVRLLDSFAYSSKSKSDIGISLENYLPIVNKYFGAKEEHDLRFDSSASDFIRCIWAYTCSLFLTSNKFSGNHPGLMMFDEPKQQDIAIEHFRSFLQELANYKNGQVLLFASFENSEESFKQATEGVEFRYNYIEKKLIKPVQAN